MPDEPRSGCHDPIDAADFPELVNMPEGYGRDEWEAEHGDDR